MRMKQKKFLFSEEKNSKWLIFQNGTALNYRLWILEPKIEEFPCLVHRLAVTLTALQYKQQ